MNPNRTGPHASESHAPTHWRKLFGDEDSTEAEELMRLCPKANPLGRTGEDFQGPPTGALLFSFDDERESVQIEPLVVFSSANEDDHPDLIDGGR